MFFNLDSFQEKLMAKLQREFYMKVISKDSHILKVGLFCTNLGKNEFSGKKGCHFLNIPIIYHSAN